MGDSTEAIPGNCFTKACASLDAEFCIKDAVWETHETSLEQDGNAHLTWSRLGTRNRKLNNEQWYFVSYIARKRGAALRIRLLKKCLFCFMIRLRKVVVNRWRLVRSGRRGVTLIVL